MTRLRRRGWLLNAGLVLLLAIAGGVTWYLLRGQEGNAEASARTTAVETGAVDKTVSAAGNIEAASQTEAGFTTSGTLTKVSVQVGTKVKKGQVLGTIDPKDAKEALEDAEYAQEQADADLESAKASLTVAEASVTDAETAKEDWEDGESSSASTETAGNAGDTGGQTQTQAQSEESLDAAIDKAEADVTSTEVKVKSAERDLASAKQDVADAKQAVSETTLKAPVAGTVVEVNGTVGDSMTGSSSSSSSSDSSSDNSSAGGTQPNASSSGDNDSTGSDTSNTSSGTAFVVIANLDKLVVTANYAEADVVDLKVGQTATVTPNAQSDQTFNAKVTSISPTATVTSNVVTYPVTLTLDDTGTGLRDGQTVSAKVLVDQADNVLRLPASSVRGTGERGTVTLVKSGVQQTVTVGVGLRGDQYLEITSGLSAGDQVVLATVTGNSSQQGGTMPGGQFGGQLGGRQGGGQFPGGNGGGNR